MVEFQGFRQLQQEGENTPVISSRQIARHDRKDVVPGTVTPGSDITDPPSYGDTGMQPGGIRFVGGEPANHFQREITVLEAPLGAA